MMWMSGSTTEFPGGNLCGNPKSSSCMVHTISWSPRFRSNEDRRQEARRRSGDVAAIAAASCSRHYF